MTADEAARIAAYWLSIQAWSQGFQLTQIELEEDVALAFYGPKNGELVAGNAPLLIDTKTGLVHTTGTARPMEYYVRNFRITGNPHIEPVEYVKITGWRTGAKTVSAVTMLKARTGLGLVEAKAKIDAVLSGQTVAIFLIGGCGADEVYLELHKIGFDVEKALCAPATVSDAKSAAIN